MQNNVQISAKWSKAQPIVDFQYGRSLFFKNGSTYISSINWDMSTEFGWVIDFDLLKAAISTNAIQQFFTFMFPLFGGNPRCADSTLKLHGWSGPRRNHVCRVSNWNLHGLQFYRGSNFRFFHWFLHGPHGSVALIRCVWSDYRISSKSEHSRRKYYVISIFQDGGREHSILLPVPNLLTSTPSNGQYPAALQNRGHN